MPSFKMPKMPEIKMFSRNKAAGITPSTPGNTRAVPLAAQPPKNTNPYSFGIACDLIKDTSILSGAGIARGFERLGHLHSPNGKLESLVREKITKDYSRNLFNDSTYENENIISDFTKDIGKIDDKISEAKERVIAKQDFKDKWSELKKDWKNAAAAEKATAGTIIATLPITVPLVLAAGVGVGVPAAVIGGLGWSAYKGISYATEKTQDSNAYKDYRSNRDVKNAEFETRIKNYQIQKNNKSAEKATNKAKDVARGLGIAEQHVPEKPPQHPLWIAAAAEVRGTHVIRDIPWLRLGYKYQHETASPAKPNRFMTAIHSLGRKSTQLEPKYAQQPASSAPQKLVIGQEGKPYFGGEELSVGINDALRRNQLDKAAGKQQPARQQPMVLSPELQRGNIINDRQRATVLSDGNWPLVSPLPKQHLSKFTEGLGSIAEEEEEYRNNLQLI